MTSLQEGARLLELQLEAIHLSLFVGIVLILTVRTEEPVVPKDVLQHSDVIDIVMQRTASAIAVRIRERSSFTVLSIVDRICFA